MYWWSGLNTMSLRIGFPSTTVTVSYSKAFWAGGGIPSTRIWNTRNTRESWGGRVRQTTVWFTLRGDRKSSSGVSVYWSAPFSKHRKTATFWVCCASFCWSSEQQRLRPETESLVLSLFTGGKRDVWIIWTRSNRNWSNCRIFNFCDDTKLSCRGHETWRPAGGAVPATWWQNSQD